MDIRIWIKLASELYKNNENRELKLNKEILKRTQSRLSALFIFNKWRNWKGYFNKFVDERKLIV